VDRSALCECLYLILLSLSSGCSHVVSVKFSHCCLLVSDVRNEHIYDVLWYSPKVVVDPASSRYDHEVVCVCGECLVLSREHFLSSEEYSASPSMLEELSRIRFDVVPLQSFPRSSLSLAPTVCLKLQGSGVHVSHNDAESVSFHHNLGDVLPETQSSVQRR